MVMLQWNLECSLAQFGMPVGPKVQIPARPTFADGVHLTSSTASGDAGVYPLDYFTRRVGQSVILIRLVGMC